MMSLSILHIDGVIKKVRPVVMQERFSQILNGKNYKVLTCLYADNSIMLTNIEKDLKSHVHEE